MKASDSLGSQASPEAASSPAYRSNASADASSSGASGSTSPKSSVPFPSRSAGVLCGSSAGSVPQSAPSVTLKRFPGCASVVPSESSRSNGTALSGSSAALEPASRMTSYSASDGVPATTPSIRS